MPFGEQVGHHAQRVTGMNHHRLANHHVADLGPPPVDQFGSGGHAAKLAELIEYRKQPLQRVRDPSGTFRL